ncbi:uncharacterized protein TNIN_273901 [Trichonephila inaurata madagascariensis]|uniref:SANT domain-containing protein n=1 Tax=Trichonephila inaurata madagascariensis TaxID=2747483 RepID=A0A8X6XBK5_9ARAC|nr:uncharacterized protein TNIN_273901 [Trichonephila inaurata madagascariensis]
MSGSSQTDVPSTSKRIDARSSRYKVESGWSHRELYNLAAALQKYGFGDMKKLSKVIQTKNEASINACIQYYINKIRRKKREDYKKEKGITTKGLRHSWAVTKKEQISSWPSARKWKKVAEHQMPFRVRKQDYSRIVIRNLCEKFYEEAEETENPQLLNVKSVYKFMLDCVSGNLPGQLGPIESAYVLVMINLMKEMVRNNNFQEEFKFVQNFEKATEFIPIEVKDEFRKNPPKDPNTVPIPIDLYENLMRHHQVVHSFNPLGVPLWLLEKEQKYLGNLMKKITNSAQSSTE